MTEPPPGNQWADLAKIVAVGSAFAGLLSALAVAGVVGSMERNHGVLFVIACALVLAAAALWVIAALRHVQGDWEKGFQISGVVLLVFGLVAAVLALALTQHDPNRPNITASLHGNVLHATIEASGLDAHDRVEVHVDGLTADPTSQELRVAAYHNLYWTAVGPDSSGDVKLPISIEIPNGLYDAVGVRAFTGDHSDCLQSVDGKLRRENGPGCAIFQLPQRPLVPQLRTSWHGSSLTASASASNAAGTNLILTVEAFQPGHLARSLAWVRNLADTEGHAALRETVRPPAGVARVCVAAFLMSGDDKAPPEHLCSQRSTRAAVALLRVPGR